MTKIRLKKFTVYLHCGIKKSLSYVIMIYSTVEVLDTNILFSNGVLQNYLKVLYTNCCQRNAKVFGRSFQLKRSKFCSIVKEMEFHGYDLTMKSYFINRTYISRVTNSQIFYLWSLFFALGPTYFYFQNKDVLYGLTNMKEKLESMRLQSLNKKRQ